MGHSALVIDSICFTDLTNKGLSLSHSAVYLASQSPRRAELLSQIGVPFDVLKVDVPEVRKSEESPLDYVLRLSHEKACAGARLKPSQPVIGSDTIVECEGRVLEKPRDQAHAAQMLSLLSGRTHSVHTAVSVVLVSSEQAPNGVSLNNGAALNGAANGMQAVMQYESISVTSHVRFRSITEAEMAAYWATGEPCDKAGGYGIQGFGGVFVEHLEGSYSAVMGLPVAQTQQLLAKFNIPYWQSS